MAKDPRVAHWLAAMEMEIRDAEFVFDLLDDGDGRMSAKEMVLGFSRMKGTARSLDIMALVSLTRKALSKLELLHQKHDKQYQAHMAGIRALHKEHLEHVKGIQALHHEHLEHLLENKLPAASSKVQNG